MNDLIRRQDALKVSSMDSGIYIGINNLQPVDAVEVVRCKDCKYFDGECCDRYADETLGYSHSTQPNFFCAVGERKTDG